MNQHFKLFAVLCLLGGVVSAVAAPPAPVSPLPSTRYEYDIQGNLAKRILAPSVSGLNLQTQFNWDLEAQLINSIDAKGGVTRFQYDLLGAVKAVTDPRGQVTFTPANGLGDVTQVTSPDTGQAQATFDSGGNMLTRTDARGVATAYTYDALGRLTRQVHAGGGFAAQTVTYGYDEQGDSGAGVGRLTSAQSPTSSVRFRYDALGRVNKSTQRVAGLASGAVVDHAVGYTYDVGNNLAAITYPSGRVLFITRNGEAVQALALAPDASSPATYLLSQIQSLPFGDAGAWMWHTTSGPRTHDRTFDTSGRVVRYTLGDKLRDLVYDEADRISSYTHYDAITGSAAPSADQQFSYDQLNRLSSVSRLGRVVGMEYDANGNRVQMTDNSLSGNYGIAQQSNRMLNAPFPNRSFGVDAAGNRVSQTGNQIQGGYIYDAAGRLRALHQIQGPTMIQASFAYDAFGKRISKNSFLYTPGASKWIQLIFVYDQSGHLIGEYDFTGKAVREYIWLQDTPVVMFTPDPANPTGQPLVYFIHTDHLNTPRVVLDRNNAIRWRWMDEPFGANLAEENPSNLGPLVFNLRFPGQVFDAESGLHYNMHRYYEPGTGRYTQSDPIGLAGGINTYSYVENNPTSSTDPEGLVGPAGAVFGASKSVLIQVAICRRLGGDIAKCLSCLDLGDVAISAAVGFLFPTLLGDGGKTLAAISILSRTTGLPAGAAREAFGSTLIGVSQGVAVGVTAKAAIPPMQVDCDDACEKYRLPALLRGIPTSF